MWRELNSHCFIDLKQTLFSGQIFHFEHANNTLFLGNVHNCLAILAQYNRKVYFVETCDQIEQALEKFFNLDVQLPSSLKEDGLRFLTNDINSAIFSFICSSNNNIKRISKMVKFIYSLGTPFEVEAMLSRYKQSGTINGSHVCSVLPGIDEISDAFRALKVFKFPDLKTIEKSLLNLQEQRFGYRSTFIIDAARFLQDNNVNWSAISFESARSILMNIKGVGRKVADCICLTSLRFFHVVPLDTHIIRYSIKEFNLKHKTLTDKMYSGIQRMWTEKYGEYAGIQQLYVFKTQCGFAIRPS
ncbi:uncharacterized protein VICG_00156 [Vittaforma corneae ATCC 50505]|uniref:DNA-(apurinic or apyrimidinic site) lyase n=1 Tax=Vittaforma corneae (strain ATCC 50505) TaxID=993615 RepID=L2GPS4_VITCO|nr:uncharacterized protein VICG_00156 [Vittaforma corneae ATCC 50505]ELA42841.1 hypothetical protein VICG_00156 [Vittaforma corneae ATCC 50505]